MQSAYLLLELWGCQEGHLEPVRKGLGLPLTHDGMLTFSLSRGHHPAPGEWFPGKAEDMLSCRRTLRDLGPAQGCQLMSHREQEQRETGLAGFNAFSPPSEGRWRETEGVFSGSSFILCQAYQRSTRHLVYARVGRVSKARNQHQLVTSPASLAVC